MPKKKKIKKIKSVSFKKEKINYDKAKHETSVDQRIDKYHITLDKVDLQK